MAFQEITEFLSDKLEFPIGGKVYTVEALDALEGTKLTRLFALIRAAKNGVELSADELAEVNDADLSDEHLGPLLLGEAWDQMHTDRVKALYINRAFQTALTFLLDGREAAEAVWSEPDPVGKAPRKRRSKAPTTAP